VSFAEETTPVSGSLGNVDIGPGAWRIVPAESDRVRVTVTDELPASITDVIMASSPGGGRSLEAFQRHRP
jgi:hypothetical protein